MASKKTPFLVFLARYRNDDIVNGNKPSSYQELRTRLTSVWSAMTEDEKTEYNILAHEYNSTLVPESPIEQISNLQNNSDYFWKMQKYLTKMFECIPNDQELLNKKFILLHINCHTHDGEQYYFPAEIAALEFNLKNGLSRTYHQIIGLSKIYPKGFAGGMRKFSDNFHQISCWDEHPDDYQKILLEFSTFLKDGIINHTDLQEGTLDLPYVYTIQSEIGTNMLKTKSCLEKLYFTAFPKISNNILVSLEDAKPLCSHASTYQICVQQNQFCVLSLILDLFSNLNVRTLSRVPHMFYRYFNFKYHELREIANKCSKARIIQWMSNICIDIHKYIGLPLKPGKHIAIQLRDGSKMIIENEHLPISIKDLKLNGGDKISSIDGSLHNSTSNIKSSTLT